MTTLVQSVDWLAIAPAALTALFALAVLVADLFTPEARKPLLGAAAVAGLALALLSLLPLLDGDRATFCVPRAGCGYEADRFALTVQLLVLGGALLTALLSFSAVREQRLPAGEYWFLLLSSAAGAALLPAARDLATLVVALEVATLPSFALVGLRHGSRRSAEAALTFFLSSVTATAVTLLGTAFVYASTGSVHLDAIAAALGDVDPQLRTLARVGVVLTLVGFAFKTAAVPFHFWVPDTYTGAPLPVAAYLSVVGKAVGFSGLALVTVRAFPAYGNVWGPALAVLAALTMTLGNAAALRQDPTRPFSAVRLLAWSSVGQAGYLLVPLASAAYTDRPEHALGATLAYALMYAAVNLGSFAAVALLARGRLTDFRGLFARRPALALLLAFFLLCLAGLPPGLAGLFAKLAVFEAAIDAGLGWLAVVAAVNVALALVYYLRWTASLFRTAPEPATEEAPAPAPAPRGGAAPAAADTPGAGTARDATATAVREESRRTATARGEAAAPAPHRPVALLTALTVCGLLALALSAAPQLILRLADAALF